ncbi:MAG: SRPBCC family protein [Bacteroidota bacterium]
MMNYTLFSVLTFAALFLSVQSLRAQKKQIRITSKVLIAAELSEVYDVLRQFERFPDWSPFIVADPEQKHRVEGQNGALGSAFHWEGVGEKSVGYQTLTQLRENEYLRMDCNISVPFESEPVFEYRLRRTPEGVEVTQEFSMEPSGFSRVMMKIFGVEKEIRATNELGLERLKQLLEQPKADA